MAVARGRAEPVPPGASHRCRQGPPAGAARGLSGRCGLCLPVLLSFSGRSVLWWERGCGQLRAHLVRGQVGPPTQLSKGLCRSGLPCRGYRCAQPQGQDAGDGGVSVRKMTVTTSFQLSKRRPGINGGVRVSPVQCR